MCGYRTTPPPVLAEEQGGVAPALKKPPAASFRTFGEVMIRYIPDPDSPPRGGEPSSRWLQSAGGAELNIVVSLSRLGWKDARWVSVTPDGYLGDHLMHIIKDAVGGDEAPTELVRREPGELGIYHVWPAERKLVYQRRHSIFGQQDPAWFSEAFWSRMLLAPSQAPLQFFHLTGITPLISRSAATSWHQALSAARKVRGLDSAARSRLVISFDFNHRPSLGSFHTLWLETRPHLDVIDMLILSEGDCKNIADEMGAPEVIDPVFADPALAPAGAAGAEAFDAAAQRTLQGLQQLLADHCQGRPPTLVLPLKRTDASRNEPGRPAWQMRWSVALPRTGELVSTLPTAVQQWPAEPIGGGDAWYSGFVDGLADAGGPQGQGTQLSWSTGHLAEALRRGDMVAAVKQTVVGDFSHVTRKDLDAAMRAGPCVDPV